MLMSLLLLVVTVCFPLVSTYRGLLLGSGQWLVLNIEKCENSDQYEIAYNISRKKINRTHDCFDINVDLDREINRTHAVHIDCYMDVDGGFKYYQTIVDNCACSFFMRYAEKNVKRGLTMANVHPPDCPLQPGFIQIKNFVMDYRELPQHGVYGTFLAKLYFMYKKKRMNCLKVVLNFDVRKDDESDENDYD